MKQILGAVLGGVMVAGQAFAQDLPSAKELIDKHFAASGGKGAVQAVKSRVDKGKLTLTDMGMEAIYTSYVDPPNALNITDLSGMGVVKNGVTDGVAWSVNPFEGNSRREAAGENAPIPFGNIDRLAPAGKTIGEEEIDGKPAYKVEFALPEGTLSVFFDKATGLIVGSEQPTETGGVQNSTFGDYKEVEGVKTPHKITQVGGAFNILITLDSVDLNAEIPAETFALPEEIKALE